MASPPTVARSGTENNWGCREGRGVFIGVTTRPGRGQLGDSNGAGVAPTNTSVMSLQSGLFFAVFFTAGYQGRFVQDRPDNMVSTHIVSKHVGVG